MFFTPQVSKGYGLDRWHPPCFTPSVANPDVAVSVLNWVVYGKDAGCEI